MVAVGLPFSFIIKTLGLSPEEIEEVERLKEEEMAEQEARQQRQLEAQSMAQPSPPSAE